MWIDMHCHTKHSYDNWLEPLDLIRRAKALGLDGVCITEHYSYMASEPVEAIARDEGFLLLRGVEISTDHGHLLAYGMQDDSWNTWSQNNYLPLRDVIERINGLGGICVPAHPYRATGLGSMLDAMVDAQGFAGVETHNGGNAAADNERAMQAAARRQLPTLGGSDCHKVSQVGRCATKFDDPVRDMAGLIDAVRRGRCRGAYFKAEAKAGSNSMDSRGDGDGFGSHV